MLGILNSDNRMNKVYHLIKDKVDCILLDDFTVLKVKFDALLLPMSGLSDDNMMVVRGIDMKCSDEFFDMLNEKGVLICANVTPQLEKLPYKILNLNEFDPFVLGNSKLTAEGVLYLLLDNTQLGLLDLKVDIIGYGHSGKAIYSLLKSLMVDVRVIRRKVDQEGIDFISVDHYQKIKPYPIIINASITNIIDDLMIKKMDENLIINLVRDALFNEALLRQRHSRIIHAGVLPALYSPLSAANVLYETLMDILYEN
ncbi:MAG: hypothetical protein ACI4U3_03595 [Traorella sp.]